MGFERDEISRFLVIDGRRAYELGITCDTCQFWFTRLPGATDHIEFEDVREQLQHGLGDLGSPVVEACAGALPVGRYLPLLLDVVPTLVRPFDSEDYFVGEQVALWGVDGFWGLPHDARVPYYRAGDRAVDMPRAIDRARLFEFVVPMFPPGWLEADVVAEYASAAGAPTAVAVTVLDVKQPAVWGGDEPEYNMHWCLAHYLLDGHHKTYAAAHGGKPVRLLSFLALDEGAGTEAEKLRLAELLGEPS